LGRRVSVWRIFLYTTSRAFALPVISNVDLFGNRKRIIHFNAEVASRALNLGVTKKKLHGS
jgi:hypothetical protein